MSEWLSSNCSYVWRRISGRASSPGADLAEIKPGDTAVVFGCGSVGQ
jgi:hypothetical protein